MNDPHREIKFTFLCPEKQAVDFKIRVKYDGLTQAAFFQQVMLLYLENADEFLPVLEKIKMKKAKMGITKIRNSFKEIETGKRKMTDLSLTESEKRSLFDLIEES